jgi:hypothetical protein
VSIPTLSRIVTCVHTDWALRRPNTHLTLLERYTTPYWALLCATVLDLRHGDLQALSDDEISQRLHDLTSSAVGSNRQIVAPLVSRHIDFLEGIVESKATGLSPELVKDCLSKVRISCLYICVRMYSANKRTYPPPSSCAIRNR